MNYKELIELEGYINLWEVIPEDKHSKLANLIWEALDDEGITLSQDAELSIRVYDSIESGT
jgi:D-aminopeptidase|tara:strand:- start:96 stop:278 length:183 start_codon:yes stop_codon:yes gene_type:complete